MSAHAASTSDMDSREMIHSSTADSYHQSSSANVSPVLLATVSSPDLPCTNGIVGSHLEEGEACENRADQNGISDHETEKFSVSLSDEDELDHRNEQMKDNASSNNRKTKKAARLEVCKQLLNQIGKCTIFPVLF